MTLNLGMICYAFFLWGLCGPAYYTYSLSAQVTSLICVNPDTNTTFTSQIELHISSSFVFIILLALAIVTSFSCREPQEEPLDHRNVNYVPPFIS